MAILLVMSVVLSAGLFVVSRSLDRYWTSFVQGPVASTVMSDDSESKRRWARANPPLPEETREQYRERYYRTNTGGPSVRTLGLQGVALVLRFSGYASRVLMPLGPIFSVLCLWFWLGARKARPMTTHQNSESS